MILLGRRPPAPDVAARIAKWREKGVAMTAISGDAGVAETVFAVVAEAGAALRGVIHCANVLDDAPVGDLTWDRFDKVMHPKALGAWHLHRATLAHALDFFVMFSSWASIAGKRGGANYAAASVALDSLAHLRRHQGLPALSIDWGAWADVGWAARLGGMPVRPGFGAMRPDLGLEAMELAMRSTRSAQIAIAPIDWPRLLGSLGRAAASVWSDFAESSASASRRVPSDPQPDDLSDVIVNTSGAEMHTAVVSRLQVMAARALGRDDPKRIDPDQPLQDIGMDSIMAVDLCNNLTYSMRAAIPVTTLFDHPTLNGLTDYCIGLIKSERRETIQEPVGEDTEDLLSLIEGLSDDEVDVRLSEKRTEVAF